jgi:hypothetical protein
MIYSRFLWKGVLFELCYIAAGLGFSPGTTVSFTNRTDRQDIAEILLKVALNTTTITISPLFAAFFSRILLNVRLCNEIEHKPVTNRKQTRQWQLK